MTCASAPARATGRRGRSHDPTCGRSDPGRLALTGAVIDGAGGRRRAGRAARRPHRRRRLVPRRGGAGARRQGVHDHGQRDTARGDCRRACDRAGQRPDLLRRDRRNERVPRHRSVPAHGGVGDRGSTGAWRSAGRRAAAAGAAGAAAHRRRGSDREGAGRHHRAAAERLRQLQHGRRRGAGDLGERHVRADPGRRPRLPDARGAAAGRRLAGGAGEQGRAEPAPHLHPGHRQERRGDDPARSRLRRRGLPRAGRPRGLAAGDARPQDDRPGQRRLRDRARRAASSTNWRSGPRCRTSSSTRCSSSRSRLRARAGWCRRTSSASAAA